MKSKLLIVSLLWIAFANTAWGEYGTGYYVNATCEYGNGYVYVSEDELDYDKVPFVQNESYLWGLGEYSDDYIKENPFWIYAKPATGYVFEGWKRRYLYEDSPDDFFSTSIKLETTINNSSQIFFTAIFSRDGRSKLYGVPGEFSVFVENEKVELDEFGNYFIDKGKVVRIDWEGVLEEELYCYFSTDVDFQTLEHGIIFTMPAEDITFNMERKGFKITGVPNDVHVYVNGNYVPPEKDGTYFILPDKKVKIEWSEKYRCRFDHEIQLTDEQEYSISFIMPGSHLNFIAIEKVSLGESGNSTVLAGLDGKTCDVKLTGLTLYTDGCWNTLCLPFEVNDFKGTPLEGFTVMDIDPINNGAYDHDYGFDNGTLYFNFWRSTGIEAGKPYIVKKLDMIPDETPPIYTATAGTAGSSSWPDYNYYNLIDGTTDNRWRPNYKSGDVVFCEFNADRSVYVTGYNLISGNLAVESDPVKWTLQAKLNEGDAWTIIDSRDATVRSEDAVNKGRTQSKDFEISVPKQGTYKYFRFEVTANGGGPYVCLTNIAIQGTNSNIPVNVVSPEFKEVVVQASSPTAVTSNDGVVSFTGSYDAVNINGEDKSILFLGTDNMLYYPNAAMSIGAFRAFFRLNNGILCGENPKGVSK